MAKTLAVWSVGSASPDAYAAHLAGQISLEPDQRVLIADLNLYTPGVAFALGLLPGGMHPHDICFSRLLPALQAGTLEPEQLQPHILPLPGLRLQVLPGFWYTPDLSRITMGQIEHLLSVLGAMADVLVAVCSVPVDDVAAFAVLRSADHVFMPVGQDAYSLYHAARYISLLDQMGLPSDRYTLLYPAGDLPGDLPAPGIPVPALPRGVTWRELYPDCVPAARDYADALAAALARVGLGQAPPQRTRGWPMPRLPWSGARAARR